jgi:hypothetical protein
LLGRSAGVSHGPLDGAGNRFDVLHRSFYNHALADRLHRKTLDAIPGSCTGQFQQPHAGGADIQPDNRNWLTLEQAQFS